MLYDRLGPYDGAWLMAIGLSVVAALLNTAGRSPAMRAVLYAFVMALTCLVLVWALALYRTPLLDMMLLEAFCR